MLARSAALSAVASCSRTARIASRVAKPLPTPTPTPVCARIQRRIRSFSSSRPRREESKGAGEGAAVEEHDVVIVGGGPVGLALAAALGASPPLRATAPRITLVEAGSLARVREWREEGGQWSNRVSSITNASRAFLADVGVWEHVDQDRVLPLENMQVWDGLSDARIAFSASEMRSVVGGARPGAHADAFPYMASMTENLNLQRALLRRLADLDVELADGVKVEAIERAAESARASAPQLGQENGWPLVRLSNGRTLRARLLIGADGFNSPVRTFAGIESVGWSYDTQAIVATLFHAPRPPLFGPNTTAFQRFLPSGPIAFLPLSPTASSLVWSTRPAVASVLTGKHGAVEPGVLGGMVNAAFRLPWLSVQYLYDRLLETTADEGGVSVMDTAGLQAEIAFREKAHAVDQFSAYSSRPSGLADTSVDAGIPLEGADLLPPLVTAVQPGTIASFPLRFNHADAYIGTGAGTRTALVGDAAHTVHPLAGQGLNLGLADAQALAEALGAAAGVGGDLGSYTALHPYARARYFENHKMMSATDHMHQLYASTAQPVVWARSVGLEVVNELDALKAAIMMSAGARTSVRRRTGGDAAGWASTAASAVQGVFQASRTATVVGEGIGKAVLNGARTVLDNVGRSR